MGTRVSKIIAILVFIGLSISAFIISSQPIPVTPWSGIFQTFWLPWMILLASVGWILYPSTNLSRAKILGVFIIAVSIALMPYQWGSLFAVRDPWYHLVLIKNETFFGINPYPAFHAFLAVLERITGISIYNLMRLAPIGIVLIGVTFILSIADRVNTGRQSYIFIILLLPVLYINHAPRPYEISLILLLVPILFILIPSSNPLQRGILIFFTIVLLLWHPLVAVTLLILISAGLIIRKVGVYPRINPFINPTTSYWLKKWSNLYIISVVGLLILTYFIFLTNSGVNLFESLLLSFTQDIGTQASSGASSENSSPVIFRVFRNLGEFFMRSVMFIMLFGMSVAAAIWYDSNSIKRFVATLGLISSAFLAVFFLILDLWTNVGFAVTRSIPIAAIILVPGGVVGISMIYRRFNPKRAMLIGFIIFLMGASTIFAAPWNGVYTSATTSGDVETTDWVVNYSSDEAVYGSRNTDNIIEARYGISEVQNLSISNSPLKSRLYRSLILLDFSTKDIHEGLFVLPDVDLMPPVSKVGKQRYWEFVRGRNKVYSGSFNHVYYTENETTAN